MPCLCRPPGIMQSVSAMGFCLVNNVLLQQVCKKNLMISRVLIVVGMFITHGLTFLGEG
jgi:acetoin utilization deacetylase AcuC-like enzyme